MSSPYGHSLIGLGLFHLCYPRWFASRGKTFLLYGLVVLGACLPDLDFLPGIFSRNPGWLHHGPFHSLGLAVGLSLMTGLFLMIKRWKRRTNLPKVQGKTVNQPSYSSGQYEPAKVGNHNPNKYLKITGFVFVLVFSHLLLDFFTEDLRAPFGFPLFWPLSETYVISPRPLLPSVMRDMTNPVFWGQNLRLFIVESLFFLSFSFLAWRLKKRGRQD